MFYDPAFDPFEPEFPLGDGTADTSAEVSCPCCGAPNDIALDPGGGTDQRYDADCQVCCRPWQVHLHYQDDGSADVWLEPADD
jgi:transposase-like protein